MSKTHERERESLFPLFWCLWYDRSGSQLRWHFFLSPTMIKNFFEERRDIFERERERAATFLYFTGGTNNKNKRRRT